MTAKLKKYRFILGCIDYAVYAVAAKVLKAAKNSAKAIEMLNHPEDIIEMSF